MFGADHQKCRFTGLRLESRSGALSAAEQAISNPGKLQFELAAATNLRREAADKLSGETAKLSTMHVAHNDLAPNDITGRQNSLHKLAAQDLMVANKRHCAALATQHKALVVRIAEVGAKLKEEASLIVSA